MSLRLVAQGQYGRHVTSASIGSSAVVCNTTHHPPSASAVWYAAAKEGSTLSEPSPTHELPDFPNLGI